MSSSLESLNTVQREAVCHVDGPLLILAGPGSGKTRVITHRIAHLVQEGVAPWQILALTFTNKAAEEMRLRLQRLAPKRPVWMGTFHRFCAQLLRIHGPLVGLTENYSILDTDDSRRVLRDTMEALQTELDLRHVTPDSVASTISWAKNNLMTPETFVPKAGQMGGPVLSRLYRGYQQRLLSANAVDFDDLLLHVALLLRENPELRHELDARYQHVMVDEYQDTNLTQYAIVRALSIDHPNLAVTGDPDQSIYSWRGANLRNILEFEKDYPQVRVVRLEENYRSTQRILRVAEHLIRHNIRRREKNLFTANQEGAPVRLVVYPSGRDEADGVVARIASEVRAGRRQPRDFAIFYRTNSLSRSFEDALRHEHIPYQIVHGLEFYQRKEVKDVLAYLQLVNNPRNNVAFQRIINNPPRSIGKSTLTKLKEHSDRYRLSMLDACREVKLIESINSRAAAAITRFLEMYDALVTRSRGAISDSIEAVLELSRYREYLENSDSDEDQERLANLEELHAAAKEFDAECPDDNRLERFLEQTSLVADSDGFEAEGNLVTMMTLHAAKGLEFPYVFVVAIEQGMLPHERNRHEPDKVEEERRLLFVGITRAEQELQLSMAQYRTNHGGRWPTVPSEFLMELPREEMQVVEPFSGRGFAAPRDEFCQVAPDDEEWRPTALIKPPAAPAEVSAEPAIPRLTTAAELTRNTPSGSVPRRFPPETFRQGMMVVHPQYGAGKIVLVSGEGEKRTATVRFFANGERSFRLAFSPLEPVAAHDRTLS